MNGAVFFQDSSERWGLVEADTLGLLPSLPTASVDAVITDPPYGIGIHQEAWDGALIHGSSGRASAGAAFADWTSSWAAECRRVLKPGGHLVAFGAPRTFHRLAVGVEDGGLEIRDLLLWLHGQGVPKSRRMPGGLGSALKPAHEPILLARAPIHGTIQHNHASFGTGALGIATTSVSTADGRERWPANVLLSHSAACSTQACAPECPVRQLDASVAPEIRPSRFFYNAKAGVAEREAGLSELPLRTLDVYNGPSNALARSARNIHPTVKPLALMRWLVRLVAPPGGLVLDPFAGSGSAGIAAVLEGRRFLGIEREGSYIDIACARLAHWSRHALKEAM